MGYHFFNPLEENINNFQEKSFIVIKMELAWTDLQSEIESRIEESKFFNKYEILFMLKNAIDAIVYLKQK